MVSPTICICKLTPCYFAGNEIKLDFLYLKILLGLVIISLLGFNILQYLQDGTDVLTKFLENKILILLLIKLSFL